MLKVMQLGPQMPKAGPWDFVWMGGAALLLLPGIFGGANAAGQRQRASTDFHSCNATISGTSRLRLTSHTLWQVNASETLKGTDERVDTYHVRLYGNSSHPLDKSK